MLKDVKAIIFDFDGTLYDFKGLPKNLVLSSLMNIFRINAVQKVRKQLKGKSFNSTEEYKNHFFGLLAEKGKFKNQNKASYWYDNLYMKKMIDVLGKKYKKRPEAEELIKIIKEHKIKIAIFSDYGMLKERLLAIGFSKEFLDSNIDVLLSSEDFGCLKPSSKGFLNVAKNLDVIPENCLVIGDRADTDGKGAFESGMQFIEIKTHKTKEGYNPKHPLLNFSELKGIF